MVSYETKKRLKYKEKEREREREREKRKNCWEKKREGIGKDRGQGERQKKRV